MIKNLYKSFSLKHIKHSKSFVDKSELVFAFGVLCIIGILIFPVPPLILDFFLSISIGLSLIILMTVLFIEKPLDFNSFPTVLLIVTTMRLALNISTTRLILANGHMGIAAAGNVVSAFGHFVTQNSVIIGIILFTILTIINFVVITKGSGRIAEVAARFALDAMPGKQMSIDADLSAGLIQESEAKQRRKELEEESAFFGAMDGANKFVRGDAVAGVLIIFINFIAGIIIGIVKKDMSFNEALETYTILTIGDGLVAQIPSLLVSISAGFLVTKSGVVGNASKAIFTQFAKYPRSLLVSGSLMVVLSFIPEIPFFPFMTAALGCFGAGYYIITHKDEGQKNSETPKEVKPINEQNAILNSLNFEVLKVELGQVLLPLVHYTDGHKLTDQVKILRQQIAHDLGFVLPSVHIQDNVKLPLQQYCIKIKDITCGSGELYPDRIMIIGEDEGKIDIPGIEAVEPAFKMKVHWIDSSLREEALLKGYTVVEPASVIITHLTEIVRENIADLLTYSEVQKLLNNLSHTEGKLVDAVVPAQISVVTLQRVLQNLLSELISIRDLSTILTALSEEVVNNKDITALTEYVRSRLSKQICASNTKDNGYIPIIVLSPRWEQLFFENMQQEGDKKQFIVAPSQLHEFVKGVNRELEKHKQEQPVILTSAMLRPFIRSVIERFKPHMSVLSQNEIHPRAKVKTLGQIS